MKKLLIPLVSICCCLSFGVAEGMQSMEDLIETDSDFMLMMRYSPNEIIAHLRANPYVNDYHLFKVISSNYISSKAKLEALQLIIQKLEHSTLYDIKRIKELTLVCAAQFGEIDLVKFLFEQGVRIDARDKEGNTALHYAMRGVDEDLVVPVRRWVITPGLVKFLVNNGADFNIKNQNGETPLDMLLYSFNNRKIENGFYIEIQKEEDDAKNILEILSFLKEHKVDITSIRQKIFAGALKKDWRAILEFVLNIGADINEPIDKNGTALHFAAQTGNAKLVKFLLQNKADSTVLDQNGQTPTELAQQEIDDYPQRWNRDMYTSILKMLTPKPVESL